MIMKVSLVVILPFVFQIMLLPLTLKKVGEIRGRVGEIRAQKSLKPMQCFLYFPAPQKMYYVRFLIPRGHVNKFRGHFHQVFPSSFLTVKESAKVGEIRDMYVN